MLDTNICIYLLKKESGVWAQLRKLNGEQVVVSSVVASELWYGVWRSTRQQDNAAALNSLLSSIAVVDYDEAAAQCYGQLRADLQQRGMIIGNMDLLIAAHALGRGDSLVTNNLKEYARIEGLRVENWVAA